MNWKKKWTMRKLNFLENMQRNCVHGGNLCSDTKKHGIHENGEEKLKILLY